MHDLLANPALAMLMRFVHIISAVVLIGGLAFMSLCLQPALKLIDDSFRKAVEQMASQRFNTIVLFGIAGLIISGIYNWIVLNPTYNAMGPVGHGLIGTKVLLAIIMFGVVFARTSGLLQPSRFWTTFNLHMGVLVIALGAVLRWFRLDYLSGLVAG